MVDFDASVMPTAAVSSGGAKLPSEAEVHPSKRKRPATQSTVGTQSTIRRSRYIQPPTPLGPRGGVDVLVTESTYGNRTHPLTNPETELGESSHAWRSGEGAVLIAAFAVGRAETLKLHQSRLRRRKAIPDIPIYLNSPMAIDASGMYQRHPDQHRLEAH